MYWDIIKDTIKWRILDFSFFLIHITERYKNRCLAARLRKLADLYDPE
jgi:hypothetical protein